MTHLTFHPVANIFPLLEGEEFDALVADIAAYGLHEPLWLYEGQILDGRNRSRACQVLGLECATRDYLGNDPVGFVLSMNLRRRHLDESQRGMVAARLATLERGVNQHTKILVPTQQQAADLLNVSDVTVQKARKVQRETAPEIIQAVDAGELTITAALPLTAITPTDPPAILEEVRREAASKRPTATHTRAVVSRAQVVATVQEEMASGKSASEAVATAFQKHEIVVATPALADAVCRATDRQVIIPANDGLWHDGRTKDEEAAREAQIKRLFQLFDVLKALATLPDLEALVAEIPDYTAYRVDTYLDQACTTLGRFATLWKAPRDADACHRQEQQEQLSLVPEGSAEPQQSRQPAQAPRGGETGPAQPRAETEDAPQPPAKSGADYDTTRFYLGKPCPHGHTYRDTGQTLRRQRKGDCVQCHRASEHP